VRLTARNSTLTWSLLPINLLNQHFSFLLAGRVLLIFLFLGFILQGEWSFVRVFVSIIGLAACVMVAVGFKAKWSAAFLVLVLSVFNVFANNWWNVPNAHPQRDFLKYVLSVPYPV
jgi:ER-derived vesicles protein